MSSEQIDSKSKENVENDEKEKEEKPRVPPPAPQNVPRPPAMRKRSYSFSDGKRIIKILYKFDKIIPVVRFNEAPCPAPS